MVPKRLGVQGGESFALSPDANTGMVAKPETIMTDVLRNKAVCLTPLSLFERFAVSGPYDYLHTEILIFRDYS